METRCLTSSQFYLITKRQQCCKRIQLHGISTYQTIFQSTLDTSLRDLQYKTVMGVLPPNTLLVTVPPKESFTRLCTIVHWTVHYSAFLLPYGFADVVLSILI